jgi:tRNA 2-thiouridine synthesizing protein A
VQEGVKNVSVGRCLDSRAAVTYDCYMTYDHDLDARGLLCPLPVLKLRKRISALEIGERIRIRTDDPAALIDVPHYCAESGHRCVDDAEDGDGHQFVIEKVS